jgi:hypothetical protein
MAEECNACGAQGLELWFERVGVDRIKDKWIIWHLYDPACEHQTIGLLPPPSPDGARDTRAQALVQAGAVSRNGRGWSVRSEAHPQIVYWTDGTTTCTCPDWQRRRPAGGCKHVRAARLAVAVEPKPTARLGRSLRDELFPV